MNTKETPTPYLGFVKAFSFCLKQFRLYSEQHPITQQALGSLSLEIDKYFLTHPKITLGCMRRLLVVDGEVTNEKEASAKDLARELERLGIEGLVIHNGVNLDETKSFLNLMAMRAKSLDEKGGFKKVMEENPYPHIKLSSGKYELVEEGQKVMGENALGGAVAGIETQETPEVSKPAEQNPAQKKVSGIADIIYRLREENPAVSAPASLPSEIDCEKVLTQLEKNPQEIVQVTLENAQDAAKVEQVIKKVVRYLVDGLLSFLVEQGKDITKALEKLAKELEKGLSKMSGGQEFEQLKKKLPAIFEEAADDLRIQMVVQTYKKNPEDTKGVQKIAGKVLKDEEVRGRLGRVIREDLSHEGFPAEKFDSIFEQIEEKAAKKKERVTVDAEELEELRRKAKNYNQELSQQVKAAVEKVEREKKVILDEKERVDSVIRNLAEGLLVVDKNGKVVLMNPAAEKLLGVK